MEKEEKLRKGVKEIRKIRMTAEEKTRIFDNILNTPPGPDKKLWRSPYVTYAFISKLYKNNFVYYGFLSCLVVALGGGAVLASGSALPGDALYSLKVKVVEPIGSTLQFSPEAKIEYQSNLATKRLIEAEILEKEDKLDEKKEAELSALLEIHTKALHDAVVDLNRDNGGRSNNKRTENRDEDNVVTDFQASMKAHAKILETLNKDSKPQHRNIKVPEKAREGGDKFREDLESKKEKNKEQYEKRRETVKSIINSANIKIEQKNNLEVSPEKSTLLESVNETLDDARKSLKEAEEENEKGNLGDAFHKLLDSESSAKEANIFFKAGIEL